MTALAITLAALLTDAAGLAPAEIDLGAAMVCAEARGGTPADRRQVAGVLRNRVRSCGGTLASVALAPGQFATPCPRAAVEPEHAVDFLAGWLGFGLPGWWSPEVVAFQTRRSARATKWQRRYGWRRVDDDNGVHTMWAGSLGGPCR
jgi:hypothetical protein